MYFLLILKQKSLFKDMLVILTLFNRDCIEMKSNK